MQTNPTPEIYITEDGSPTLWASAFGEHYHSTHGAVQESMYIFLERTLEARVAKGIASRPLQIFEIGFGTGLNALLSALWAEHHRISLIYTSIERYPISKDVYERLHFSLPETSQSPCKEHTNYLLQEQQEDTHYYSSIVERGQQKTPIPPNETLSQEAVDYRLPLAGLSSDKLLQQLHRAPWGKTSAISSYFHLHKVEGDLLSTIFPLGIDVVYFDAFSPESQPELWSEEIFRSLYQASRSGAVLSTYCAKGEVRRRLQRAGYSVSRLPGPPGKREILSASK